MQYAKSQFLNHNPLGHSSILRSNFMILLPFSATSWSSFSFSKGFLIFSGGIDNGVFIVTTHSQLTDSCPMHA